MNLNDIWAEKYRPKNLAEMVLSPTNRGYFDNAVKDGSIPHLLLVGRPGIGKTSLAKVLATELKAEDMYINASDERGIDTIRTKVTTFAQTKAMFGGSKVVILDEADGLTSDSQRALRNVMEEYSATVRFILTANIRSRIIAALQSRCETVDLTLDRSSFVKQFLVILEKEAVELKKEVLTEIIQNTYPDFRSAYNAVQRRIAQGTDTPVISDDVIQTISQEVVKPSKSENQLRKYLTQNEKSFQSDYKTLLKLLYNRICAERAGIPQDKIGECLLTVYDYLKSAETVADLEINFHACILNLRQVLG